MGKGEEIHDGEEWSARKERRRSFSQLVFPWPGEALLALLCSRLLSLFHDVTRSFFSLPCPPHPRPRPHPHIEPHLAYLLIFLSRPCLTSSSTPLRLSFSYGRLFRLAPNNTRFGHKSRTCPPHPPISLSTRTITRASAPPNRLFHWKRSRPGGLPLPSPTSPSRLLSPQVPKSAVSSGPPPARTVQ